MKWAKLGEVCEITGAGVDKKIVEGEKEIKLLNYLDVYRNQYLDNSTATMVVTASDKKIAQCDAKRGDIFITPSSETVDDIFRSAVVVEDLQNTVYSYHVLRLRLKEPNFVTSCFLNHLFQCEVFRPAIYKLAYGNTRQFVPKGDLANLKIPLPAIETQRKIAEQLDRWEAATSGLLQNLESELSLRQKQFSFYREQALNPEHLGEFEWYTLGDVCEFQRGDFLQKKHLQESGNPVVHYGQIYTRYGCIASEAISYADDEIFAKLKKAQPGDILMATTSENFEDLGKCVVWEGARAVGMSGHMCRISPNRELFNSRWLGYFLRSEFVRNLKLKAAHGVKVLEMSANDMKTWKIPLPPIETQRKIADLLDRYSAAHSALIANLERERELRSKQARYYKEQLLNFAKDQND